ncbi:MAG: pyruvate kinase [Clostridia bacterium]|nr:pyruvate kinase [Clostridia bacterium]
MRKTKIICTLGPASESEETIEKLCLAGMNVARFNFSHGTHEWHKMVMDRVKKVREKLGIPVAIMLDTKGPEYRLGTFRNGPIQLADGDKFTFTVDDIEGDKERVSVSFKTLNKELEPGNKIYVNNGIVQFVVDDIEGSDIHCTVLEGGVLSDRKSMSFPGKVLNQVFLSEKDKSDLLFGIENEVDYVAASFISNKENVDEIRNFINDHGGSGIGIIAKIENQSGVDNIYEIAKRCGGVMVARGDLGVEIPFKEVPARQKELITICRMLGRRVITATEMLESMISNPRPTRAEISDVANAVYDGTSAVMLSGESASGKYPVRTVEVMAEICEETEKHVDYKKQFHDAYFTISNNIDAISHSACNMAIAINAKAIAVCSISGTTVRMVSRFRPVADIVGLTTDPREWRKLALSWGVIPVLSEEYLSSEVVFYESLKRTIEVLGLSKGDNVIMVGGSVSGASGENNTIRLERVR